VEAASDRQPVRVFDRSETRRMTEKAARIWARIVPRSGNGTTVLHRAEWLTPYSAETIADDALRAGRGARLDVMVAADATGADIARVHGHFARLANRGVLVNVCRTDEPRAEGAYPDARASSSRRHRRS